MTNVVNSFAEVIVGSAQQSILGVFCIIAAFVLGQYIRTHPSPESLELERQQQSTLAPAPQFAIRSGNTIAQPVTAPISPRLPAPSAGFSVTTPSTDPQPVISAVEAERTEPVETFARAPRTIDVPDFSKLAASFENTPLALPQQNQYAPPVQERQPEVVTNTGSFYIRPAPQPPQHMPPSPEIRSLKPQSLADQGMVNPNLTGRSLADQNRAGQSSYVGSRPESIAPPQPTDIYQVRERPTSFRKEDFQPHLISDSNRRRPTGSAADSDMSPNDAAQTQNRSQRRRISLAPPESDVAFVPPEVPELVIKIPDAPESNRVEENQLATYNANHARNQIHSYYDVDMSESPESVLGRQDFQHAAPTAPTPTQTNRRIPFRLNDQGRRELTRIRNRQQTNIPLQTDQFSLHTTQASDTLQSLSTKYYGKPDYYLDIYLANQQTLRNPAVIPAGIQLRIPRYDPQ